MKQTVEDIWISLCNETITTKEAYSLIDVLIKMHATSKSEVTELVSLYSKIFELESSVLDSDGEWNKIKSGRK